MAKFRQIIAALSGLVLGAGLQSEMNQASAAMSVDKACRLALQANTLEALEDFFHNYPPDKFSDAPCYALALDAVGGLGSSPPDAPGGKGAGGKGGYGG